MADQGTRTPFSLSDSQSDESKMRRALGLTGGGGGGNNRPQVTQQRPDQARGRHKFVQDGGVPVTVVNHRIDENGPLKERIAELEASLENERTNHANTRRALGEQQSAAQALQTRLAHADLAHNEALMTERNARLAAQSALSQHLLDATPARRAPRPAATPQATEEPVPEPEPAAAAPHRTVAADPLPAAVLDRQPAELTDEPTDGPTDGQPDAGTDLVPAPMKAKRGRPRTAAPKEPKPVRWWTPSYRTKSKA